LHIAVIGCPILGDPGVVSGDGEKSERGREKFGQRKVENERISY